MFLFGVSLPCNKKAECEDRCTLLMNPLNTPFLGYKHLLAHIMDFFLDGQTHCSGLIKLSEETMGG